MARWRGSTASAGPEPEQLRVFLVEDWSDDAMRQDRLLGARWRPGGVTAAAWRQGDETWRAGQRWLAAWLLWHEGEDVDLVDAIGARARAKRACSGLDGAAISP